MVPSSSIAFSEFTMVMFSGKGNWISIAPDLYLLTSDFIGDCPQTSAFRPRHADANALRVDVLH